MKKLFSLLLALSLLLSLGMTALADAPAPLTATADVAEIQKYGNVVLSLPCEDMKAAGYAYGDMLTVKFLDQNLEIPFCSNYSDVDSGSPAVFARASDERVLVAINMGDFATTYGIATKTTNEDKTFLWTWAEGVEGPITFQISLHEAGGYYNEYVLHQLSYTNEREDYPELTDAQFANFRAVTTTGMGEGVLYRTSSPINPERSRNTCADAAIKDAGVTVVLNLADDEASARAYEGFDETYYSTIDFVALNMGVDFAAEEFQAKLAEGLIYLASHPGVYAIHCTEGKDRVGFVVALLECLMGATYDEIAADYMLTFYNYYGVTADDARYSVILNSNIVKTLSTAFGVADLKTADLAAGAEAYLKAIGLSDEDLANLKRNLSAKPETSAEPEVPAEPEAPSETEPETPILIAPAPETSDTTYVVVAGDCLWNLAKRFYNDPLKWKLLAEVNQLSNPHLIFIGQTLIIPA